MTTRLKSKHKVDRRLKANLWGRPKSPFNSRAYPPGQHGQNKKGKPTDYGIQLNAKQKLKSYYGNINERQFRNIYRKAITKRGDTTENLIALLESRLDTVIYRAKFATTVFSARQMINHGHIRVNKKRVNISSYLVKDTDLIEIKEKESTHELQSASSSLFFSYCASLPPPSMLRRCCRAFGSLPSEILNRSNFSFSSTTSAQNSLMASSFTNFKGS